MRKLLALLLLVGCSSAPKPVWKQGKEVGTARPIPATKVDATPVGTEVVLDGKVSKVCKNRGCWVQIDGVMAKSFEHEVLFPLDCEGKRAVVRGVVRHQDEEKKHEGDGCPNPKIVIEILGAELY